MKTTDSDSQNAAAAPPRRRGAPKGNRNAWKHGKRSAAAKAARAAKRERLMRLLPDAGVFVRAAAPSDPQGLGCDGELERILSNAKNRSAGPNRGEGPPSPFFDGQNEQFGCVAKKGEGDPPPHFSTNKANNSAAAGAKRPRGAPKGNSNALKHGFRSGKRREFGAALRIFLYRVDATSRLANSMANVRKIR